VIPDARVIYRGEMNRDLELRVEADPGAMLFTQPVYVNAGARVCGSCGYVELYAANPAELLAAWRASQGQGG
jgi:hypothetical protein